MIDIYTENDRDRLEKFVDQFGINQVIEMLVEIAGLKAEHLRVNYQAEGQAKIWEDFALKIEKVEF